MTINKKSCSSDYSPMQKSLPVENGGKTVTIFTDSREIMDSKVKPSGDEEDQPCGWRSCQLRACQRFRRAGWMLFWLCWAGAIQVRKIILTFKKRNYLPVTQLQLHTWIIFVL
jgi:hypothetical protein